jgi:hypothetical protein
VAFGSVWKESLTELSGGQRSLLALSLVLALCKYKPAPIYILDEVRAGCRGAHRRVPSASRRHWPPRSPCPAAGARPAPAGPGSARLRTAAARPPPRGGQRS